MKLIDADELMNDINSSINEMTNVGVAVDVDWLWAKLNDALENATTVEPELNSSESPNGWIPCEKKLPEKSEKYEVTIKNVITIFDGETEEVVERVGYYVDCDIYKSYLLRKWHRYDGGQVIAWRKLPEPYQPKEEAQ